MLTYGRPGASPERFLRDLVPALEAFPASAEVLVVNNGGAAHRGAVERAIAASGIGAVARPVVLDSPANDIAVARNLVLDRASAPLVAFLDDDEAPVRTWLVALVDCLERTGADVVAGPVHVEYAGGAAPWLTRTDLHPSRGRLTGERLPFAGAGNCLVRARSIGAERFDLRFGRTGGEDTEFFMRLADRGLAIVWCAEAVAVERASGARGTTRHALRRFLNQGATYRRVLRARGRRASGPAFALRAAALFAGSLPVAAVLLLLGRPSAGTWLMRAVSNLGKLVGPARSIYAPVPAARDDP